jgi:hypothetical protein
VYAGCLRMKESTVILYDRVTLLQSAVHNK